MVQQHELAVLLPDNLLCNAPLAALQYQRGLAPVDLGVEAALVEGAAEGVRAAFVAPEGDEARTSEEGCCRYP